MKIPVFICRYSEKVVSLPSNGDAAALSRGIKGNLVRIQNSTRYCEFHYRKYKENHCRSRREGAFPGTSQETCHSLQDYAAHGIMGAAHSFHVVYESSGISGKFLERYAKT